MPETETKLTKSILIFLFTVVLFDMIGATILVTVQAFIVKQYNSTALAVSLLIIIYAAAQFIAAPILGRISDRYGRRPILLICLLGSAIGYIIFGIGGALWVLYLSRVIDGFTGGNISIAQAYIADVSPLKDRTKNLALISVAFGLGFIIGPIFGGLFSLISLNTPAYIAGLFSLTAAIIGLFILPESLTPKKRNYTHIKWNDLNPLKSIGKMLKIPVLASILLVYCIANFVFNGFNINVPIYLIYKFNAIPIEVAGLLFVVGIIMAIVQGGLIGKLSSKYGDKKLIMTGLLIQAIGFILFIITTSFWIIYLIGAIISVGAALRMPTMYAVLSKSVPASQQGEIFGVSTSLFALMNILGPLWAGLVYDNINPSAPYWMGAILLIIAFIVMNQVRTDSTITSTKNNT